MNHAKKTRYTLVTGQFTIHDTEHPLQGPQPDGDTVTFIPDSLDTVLGLRKISSRPPAIRNGHIAVRYEGIDALETQGARQRQPGEGRGEPPADRAGGHHVLPDEPRPAAGDAEDDVQPVRRLLLAAGQFAGHW